MILLIAAAWTVLNAIKPVHVDDDYFMSVARHIAHHPTDPFGFVSFWYEWPEPGFWVVCPMVLPYWLALPAALFWDTPFIIKMWMLPFAIAFVWSVHALLKRFVGRHVMLLLVVIVASPAFLPSINVMIDIPALGLALLALEVFIRSTEKQSIGQTLLAGLLAGLAMQTKYSVFALPIALLVYGFLFRKVPQALLACLVASAIFWGWEGLLFLKYGQSHFIAQIMLHDPISTNSKLQTWARLPGYLSGAMPMLIFLSIVLLRWRPIVFLSALLLLPLGYFGLTLPIMSRVLFVVLTILIFAAIGVVLWNRSNDRVTWFLAAWMMLEIASSLASSPFAGERRVFGIVIACTLLVCRLCFFGREPQLSPKLLRWAAAVSIAIALVAYLADVDEAIAWRDAVYAAVAHIRRESPNATIWYDGHWGVDYYGPKLGAKPVIPDNTVVRQGDWLLMFIGMHRQAILPAPNKFEGSILPAVFLLPWSLTSSYYGGDTPMAWREGDHCVWLMQATDDAPIQSTYANGEVIEVAEGMRHYFPDAALPALIGALKVIAPDQVPRGLAAIEAVGARAEIFALGHGESDTRAWAARKLGDRIDSDPAIDPALEAARSDPELTVRQAAEEALRKRRTLIRR
jgi:hypothetical protein